MCSTNLMVVKMLVDFRIVKVKNNSKSIQKLEESKPNFYLGSFFLGEIRFFYNF
jgi:hypothetical protein